MGGGVGGGRGSPGRGNIKRKDFARTSLKFFSNKKEANMTDADRKEKRGIYPR